MTCYPKSFEFSKPSPSVRNWGHGVLADAPSLAREYTQIVELSKRIVEKRHEVSASMLCMYTTSSRRRLRATKARRAQPAGCDICATYNPDATASRARGIWVVRYERMRRCKHQTTTARGRRTTRVGEQTHHPREGPRAWERCPHRHPYPTHPHPLHAPVLSHARVCLCLGGRWL